MMSFPTGARPQERRVKLQFTYGQGQNPRLLAHLSLGTEIGARPVNGIHTHVAFDDLVVFLPPGPNPLVQQ